MYYCIRRRSLRAPFLFACAVCCLIIIDYLILSKNFAVDTSLLEVAVLCASTENDAGYRRWRSSSALWGARGEPLGRGREWKGHGTKLNLLRERLQEMMDARNHKHIVLYTDSQDVMFVGAVFHIIGRFINRDARVLFAAEVGCWPDSHLKNRYPASNHLQIYPYLNSGGIIGYVSTLYELLTLCPLRDDEDDQRYYTQVYLNESLRERLKIRLDHKAEIFQCLYNASDHIQVVSQPKSWPYLRNTMTGGRPLILHANGPQKSKAALAAIEAQLVNAWISNKHLAPREHVPRNALDKILFDVSRGVPRNVSWW